MIKAYYLLPILHQFEIEQWHLLCNSNRIVSQSQFAPLHFAHFVWQKFIKYLLNNLFTSILLHVANEIVTTIDNRTEAPKVHKDHTSNSIFNNYVFLYIKHHKWLQWCQ